MGVPKLEVNYHWSKNHYTRNFYCRGIHFAIAHTSVTHNFNYPGINLCNACVSPVSACLASIISQKGNYTTIPSRTKVLQIILFKNNCFGTINLVKSQNNLFTKQNPSHVLLQTGTNQWQQYCKDNFLVDLIM